ncbi:hypothetical protein [Oligoflexus tunisiensis]|uniref:hypothetical protein n=1 Tax=Oligoflexus tunisiensis TaxID=708132 RepID=UPI00114CF7A3|nr:hypothetical protein [Oligoflexus tunisiensis]
MSTAVKKQKNREYYLKNREKILSRARERNYSKRRDHLEIVPNLRSEDAQSENSSGAVSGLARPSEKIHQLSSTLQDRSRVNSAPGSAIAADGALALFDVAYEISPSSIDNTFFFKGKGTRMEQTLKLVDGMPLKRKASDSDNAAENPSVRRKGRLFSKIPLSFILRLLLVACLTLLMTAMQVEFYREHDILPEYAVPLALASEVAFLSLVSMKFSRSLEWLRIIIHLIFFGYFVSALSFHVYAKSRSKAASEQMLTVPELTGIREQLKQAERSLDAATKGRAWRNMEIFGAEVFRLRKLISATPNAQVLGTSLDQTLWIESVLLILLRALLLAASALNALRLRDQVCEMTHGNRSVMVRV